MLHVQASQAGKLGKACWQVYQAVVLCSTSSSGSNASCKAYVSTCLLAYAHHMTLQTQADAQGANCKMEAGVGKQPLLLICKTREDAIMSVAARAPISSRTAPKGVPRPNQAHLHAGSAAAAAC